MPSNDLQDLLTKANRIREAHARDITAIRDRSDLVGAARVALIAKTHLDGTARMRELRQTFSDDLTRRQDAAERSAFSPVGLRDNPAAAAAWRDATSHAVKLTRADVAAMALARANRDSDEAMAVAIGAHAADLARNTPGPGNEKWGEIVDQFTSTRPRRAAAVEALVEAAGDRADLAGSPFVFGLFPPIEVGHAVTDQLQTLAASAP